MAVGNLTEILREATDGCTGQLHVYFSKRRFEEDPFSSATEVFSELGLQRTQDRNSVLIYMNMQKKQFAIVTDIGLQQKTLPDYWKELSKKFQASLCSIPTDIALEEVVKDIGQVMKKNFPVLEEGEIS